jgi:hypothetical protein
MNCRKQPKTTGQIVKKRGTMPKGKPFQPGPDPRRHKFGRASLNRADFMAKLNNALCNGIGEPDEIARILWKYARMGRSWALVEIMDRIGGRVPQSVQLGPLENVTYKVVYDEVPTTTIRVHWGKDSGRLMDPAPSPRVLEAISEGDKKRQLEAAKVVPAVDEDDDIFEQ